MAVLTIKTISMTKRSGLTLAALAAAGWSPVEIHEATLAWLPAPPGLPPVPRPRAYVSAREALIYGLLFLLLGLL